MTFKRVPSQIEILNEENDLVASIEFIEEGKSKIEFHLYFFNSDWSEIQRHINDALKEMYTSDNND